MDQCPREYKSSLFSYENTQFRETQTVIAV